MKKVLLFAALILVGLMSCETPGTSKNVDLGNHPKYNIEKYYFSSDDYVYIITRKDSLLVENVTRVESNGKTTTNRCIVIDNNERLVKEITVYQYEKNQIIMENDSIVIIRK